MVDTSGVPDRGQASTGPWAGRWVADKIDEDCLATARALVHRISEHIALATSDSVTVRVVSADGRSLEPLTANHPVPGHGEAMAAIMSRHQALDDGLWGAVFAQRSPVAWHLPVGRVPEEATGDQADFIRTYGIRSILGAPVQQDGQPVGGVALVRFAAGRAFDEDEMRLLVTCCRRLAPVLAWYRSVLALRSGGSEA